MTVETEQNLINHDADGIQDTFAYPFLVQQASDLKVLEDGTTTTLAFTVFGVGDVNGGTVVFSPVVPLNGVVVTLERIVDLTQLVDYQPFDAFPAETHEDALDKLTMAVQQVKNSIGSGRTITIPESDPVSIITELPEDQDRASEFFAFDSAGNVITLGAISVPVSDPGGLNYEIPNVAGRANQFLAFDVNGNVIVATGTAGTLGGLVDVTLTAPADLEVLTFDDPSQQWVNRSPAAAAAIPYDIAFLAGFDEAVLVDDLIAQGYATLICPRDIEITLDIGDIQTVPTGAAVTIDVKVEGVSIYTGLPSFADTTGNFTAGTLVGGLVAISAGEVIEFSIAQIGATTPGQGVTFSLIGRVA